MSEARMCGNTTEPLTDSPTLCEVRQMAARNDITGQKFGRLTVVLRFGTDRHGKATWVCRCDCGRMVMTITGHLRNGNTRSCGCLQKAKAAISAKKVQPLAVRRGNKNALVHGHTSQKFGSSPTYRSWQAMLGRCIYPKIAGYYRYGAIGISVCERWRKFENFLEDVGVRPSVDYCIARKDDLGNYEPGNACWKLKTDNNQEMLSRRRVKALVRRWWITK